MNPLKFCQQKLCGVVSAVPVCEGISGCCNVLVARGSDRRGFKPVKKPGSGGITHPTPQGSPRRSWEVLQRRVKETY